ncbi:hypothetical protein WJX73_005134 [Symbiochloris irregularis]|uniref:Mismatch repair endonuclease PMS2 n=1 Tax=Symbiochloris irregularis TaxID=706552 RepID=A0AAW1NK22_9CHLO
MELKAPERRIKAIDRAAVHRICSGQVVLDLATAVKELVENAIDAGATNVEVRVREYGSELVEVADNGCGVSATDYQSLTLKYHTSKLQQFNDLQDLSTFGFRGEALSSLCAVASVCVTTRTGEQAAAARLAFSHSGQLASSVPAARAVGTTVSVADIFKPLPVRFKEFRRNIKREYAKLLGVLQGYALICTGVRLICTNQVGTGARVTAVASQGASTVRDNIAAVMGARIAEGLQPLTATAPCGARITGWVSKAGIGHGKAAGDRQFLFLNGRPVDLPQVTKVLNETFRSLSSASAAAARPTAVLDLQLPRHSYDINLTPDKRKVLLHEEGALLEALQSALEQAWEPSRSRFAVSQALTNPQAATTGPATPAQADGRMGESAATPTHPAPQSAASRAPALEAFSQHSSQAAPLQTPAPRRASQKLLSAFMGPSRQAPRQQEPLPSPAAKSGKQQGAPDVATPLQTALHEVPDKQLSTEPSPPSDVRPCAGEVLPDQSGTGPHVSQQSSRDSAALSPADQERQQHSDTPKAASPQRDTPQPEPDEAAGSIPAGWLGAPEFNRGFIIARLGLDLFMIDQHASDEKFNFERLQGSTTLNRQPLVCPEPLHLTATEALVIRDNMELMRQNGFDIADGEDGALCLTAVPFSRNTTFGASDVQELAQLLLEGGNPSRPASSLTPSPRASMLTCQTLRPSRVRAMLAMRACRSSIMIGRALDEGRMRLVLGHMADLVAPWNCPHGRPTMRHLAVLPAAQGPAAGAAMC